MSWQQLLTGQSQTLHEEGTESGESYKLKMAELPKD
jgi:hypothetical protein